MIIASELAGFFAAHAIWCVSESESFIPMLAYTTEDGKREMMRLALDDVKAAIELGKKRLEENDISYDDAVLLYDGRISHSSEKLDALIMELRCEAFRGARATLAVPYTPKSKGAFLVHKPKLIEWENSDDFDMDAALEAFWRGVASHEKGSKIWNDCLDESK